MITVSVTQNTIHDQWDTFLKERKHALFNQSSSFGEFYKSRGESYWIVLAIDKGVIVGGSLVLSTHAKRGSFLYLPYGPVLQNDERRDVAMAIMKRVEEIARSEKMDFIRVSPFLLKKDSLTWFKALAYRESPMHVLAEDTWLLDIDSPEENILAGMKKNHRNLVRRCEREGVEVTMHTSDEALNRLNDMHDRVAKRHGFERFSRDYITQEFHAFLPDHAVLFEAKLPDGRVDGSAIIMFYGNMACYRHSASLNLNKRLPTAYAIQWAAILEAKRRGCTIYNFWGVAPSDASPSHPFTGITHFKKGFGGRQAALMTCHDRPLTWKYAITFVLDSIRKWRKHF